MKQCLQCKEVYSPLNQRSFHTFPSDCNLRTKWLNILNLPMSLEVKFKFICSDHFSADSFHQSEGRSRRRLLTGALPVVHEDGKTICLSEPRHIQQDQCDVVLSPPMYKHVSTVDASNDSLVAVTEGSRSSHESFDNTRKNDYADNSSLEDSSITVIQSLTTLKNASTTMNMQESSSNYFPLGTNTASHSNGSVLQNCASSVNSVNVKSNSRKRKLTCENYSAPKKIKIMDGCETHYISRSQFLDDEGWNVFLIYKKVQERKLAAAQNKKSRRNKKIKCLTGVIQNLKNTSERGIVENFLKVN
ncbi:uncharacterized protein LOC106643869 [Copidosoma floridanum]|uniref:uncharacterized protein LOC106643869 n=1 Tax=Copidosoma floridanum TaxID=29053 RepID=UPI000C6F8F0F|nr:uncharacterized protein LOC106643869 [Copidosoma floridanum]